MRGKLLVLFTAAMLCACSTGRAAASRFANLTWGGNRGESHQALTRQGWRFERQAAYGEAVYSGTLQGYRGRVTLSGPSGMVCQGLLPETGAGLPWGMKYLVQLKDEERTQLRALLKVGSAPTRKLTHARILLKADQNGSGLHDKLIAQALDVNPRTVLRVRQRYVLDGLEAALDHLRPQRFKPKKLDERTEAHLIALACSAVPESLGHKTWTLRLLADQMVELGHVDAISHETVRVYLKKTS